ELKFRGNYQLLVSVILSAQCTDKKVNETTPELFNTYPNFLSLSKARLSNLEKIIRPINYYKSKSKHLLAMAKSVVANFNGKIPRSHQELTSLAGVGNKTANVILSELGIEPALPVDTHVFRVSKRLGLAKSKDRDKVELELKQEFQAKDWRNLHHWLIFHGRRVCKAQNPQCELCALSELCPSAESFNK
ncbi:MAG: endonuclease III, partial [Bdellovibrionales bacterium]|nr:endonuclease III [Bdellovibrionales bacterium]